MSVWVFGRGLLPVTRRPIDTNALITNIVYGWMVWLVVLIPPPNMCVCVRHADGQHHTVASSICFAVLLGLRAHTELLTGVFELIYA